MAFLPPMEQGVVPQMLFAPASPSFRPFPMCALAKAHFFTRLAHQVQLLHELGAEEVMGTSRSVSFVACSRACANCY